MSNDMLQPIANELFELGVPNSVIDAAKVLTKYLNDKNSYIKQQLLTMTMSDALITIIKSEQSTSQIVSPSLISKPYPKLVQLSANSVSSPINNTDRSSTVPIVSLNIKPLTNTHSLSNHSKIETSKKDGVEMVSPVSPISVKIVRPRTIVTTPLRIERTTVAIIGSAGKNIKIAGKNYSLNNVNSSIFDDMVSRATALINEHVAAENIELISGGAAWSDHVAVQIYINHKQGGQSSSSVVNHKNYILSLYLPALFNNFEFLDTGDPHWSANPGRISNNYHRRFSEALGDKSGLISRQQIAFAIKLGASVYTRKGFHKRNSDIARAQYLYAFTWEQEAPTVGGTADTWNKALMNGSNCRTINLYELAYPGSPYPQTIPDSSPSIPVSTQSHVSRIKPLQLCVIPSTPPPPIVDTPSIVSKLNIKPLCPIRPSPPQTTTLSFDLGSTNNGEPVQLIINNPTSPPVQFVDLNYVQPDVLEESEPEIYSDKARTIIHSAIGDAISADDDATMTAQLKIILHRYDGDLNAFLQDVESSGTYNYVVRYGDVPTNFVDIEELEELVDVIHTYQNEC